MVGSSQRPVRTVLAAEQDETRNVRVLWGINGVALEATPRVIDRLAALPSVRWVLYDRATGHTEIDGNDPVWALSDTPLAAAADLHRSASNRGDSTGPTGGDTSGPNSDATVRGEVIAMGAQQVWDQLDYTGAGVIVAVIDTGVDRTHPGLADHMWTNLDEIAGNAIDDDGNGYVDDTWG